MSADYISWKGYGKAEFWGIKLLDGSDQGTSASPDPGVVSKIMLYMPNKTSGKDFHVIREPHELTAANQDQASSYLRLVMTSDWPNNFAKAVEDLELILQVDANQKQFATAVIPNFSVNKLTFQKIEVHKIQKTPGGPTSFLAKVFIANDAKVGEMIGAYWCWPE